MQVLAEAKRISELRIQVIFNCCFCMKLTITGGEEEENFFNENSDNVYAVNSAAALA